MERNVIVDVDEVIDEADGIRTLYFKHSMKAQPGQFVMIWIPNIDEKPFAISDLHQNRFAVTVSAVGEFSRQLYEKKVGETVGIRGPYGTAYGLNDAKGSVVMVGGGYGTASLKMLAPEALEKGLKVKIIIGAQSKNKLVYVDEIKKLIGDENVIITTDDGSEGIKGRVTDALIELIQNDKPGKVFACGPDKMMKAVADLCRENNVDGEVSMERWMKCGYGLCGHCSMDPLGLRVCVEGPVMNFETAGKLTEFGKYHRVKSSRKENL